MTNPDTNTLNGALEQLGITMADNLVTMGVSDADPSDGLTTLAGKILDIGPTPPTPTPANISLTADKSILSYADTESAVLTATVLDSSSNPVEGVSVDLYKDSVLWDTLTTDSSGEVSKTYTSAGIGDVGFTAECGSLVTERFVVEDCSYYNPNSITSDMFVSISLPIAFELSFKCKRTSSSSNISLMEIGGDTGNTALFGQLGSNGFSALRLYNSEGSSQYSDVNVGTTSLNADSVFKWIKNGSDNTVSLNNTVETVTNSLTHNKIKKLSVVNNIMKELKVKPL